MPLIVIEDCVYRTMPDGRIFWANPNGWLRIDEFADKGIFTRVDCGPDTYGHTNFYWNPPDKAEGR